VPHHKSAKKRVKSNEVRRQRNVARRSRLRHGIRDARALLKSIGPEPASEPKAAALDKLREVERMLDRMAARGVIHENKASRLKSRLLSRMSG